MITLNDLATKKQLTKKEILDVLHHFKNNNQSRYKILQLGLFGSVARESFNQASDVDVVVKLEKQDLWNIIGIKQDLEELLAKPVDVVSYQSYMNSFLRKRIDQEAIYV